jgi:methionyl-tRNA formyltransferase
MAERLASRLGASFDVIRTKEELTRERLDAIGPAKVFFPHWSFIIPAEIHRAHECVIFHMTDVPFGRGGSPLQNLLSRGIYETKISALRCVDELDAGPVYMKHPLTLEGRAEDIYARAAAIVEDMIARIVTEAPSPVAQTGTPTVWKRRKPADGSLAPLSTLVQIYDHIRMLDATGYPAAFVETEAFRFELSGASLDANAVTAKVRIVRKASEEKGQ